MAAALVNAYDIWVGLSRTLFFGCIGYFLASYDLVYTRAEQARRESQRLLSELQVANQKLRQSAAQVEALAAAQERNRLTRELHDSVGQMIFSITLNAQATRLLLEKDPARVPQQLDQLQDLTTRALGQMRALISQWRPSSNSEK